MLSLKEQLELDGYIEIYYKKIKNSDYEYYFYRNPSKKGDTEKTDLEFINALLGNQILFNTGSVDFDGKTYSVKVNKNKSLIRIINNDKCELIECRDINEFLDAIKELKESEPNTNIYFRGQASYYSWIPSLYREDKWIENEFRLNAEVISKHVDEFITCKSTIERLIKLKHFNQPSRLLDIVANPLMALYFACESSVENNSSGIVSAIFSDGKDEKYTLYSDTVILLSNISKVDMKKCFMSIGSEYNDSSKREFLDELSHQSRVEIGIDSYFRDDFNSEDKLLSDKINDALDKLKNCIVIHPELNNPRIIQQQGMFILCGFDVSNSKTLPIESYNNLFLTSDKKRIYFLFSDKAMKNIKAELDSYGINKSQVYFDLEKTIEYEKNKVLGKI